MIFLTIAISISDTAIELMVNVLLVSNEITLKDYLNDKQTNSGMSIHFNK